MCEKPPFRQWLPRVLIGAIRKVPGLIGGIRSPLFEMFIGIAGIFVSVVLSLIILGVTFWTRVIMALCAIPSFIILLHGVYREDDC